MLTRFLTPNSSGVSKRFCEIIIIIIIIINFFKFLFSQFFVVPQKGFIKARRPSQNLFQLPQRGVKIKYTLIFSVSPGSKFRVEYVDRTFKNCL